MQSTADPYAELVEHVVPGIKDSSGELYDMLRRYCPSRCIAKHELTLHPLNEYSSTPHPPFCCDLLPSCAHVRLWLECVAASGSH